jgi:2',3'-cyclic-nucleotide 2'-phosphodiesterase (5'-nucleotidase family)
VALEDDRTYTLAATEFMLAGGDGYAMLKEGAEPRYLGFADNAVLIEMLRQKGTVRPEVEGRIVFR